jgi:hypothetical protein
MANGPPNMRPPSSHPNGQIPQQPMGQEGMMGPGFRPQPAGRGQPGPGGVWAGPQGMQQPGQPPMQQLQGGPQPVSQPNVAGGVQGRPIVGMMPPPAQPGGPVGARPVPTSPNMTTPQPQTPTQANKAMPKKREGKPKVCIALVPSWHRELISKSAL